MIIVLQRDEVVETYGCLTKVCLYNPEFKYHTLKDKKFPFEYKGWRFVKVKYNK